jgi:hypothetical protein
VGVEYSASSNETDVAGFRDNKNVRHEEKSYKNGSSASLAGFGAEVSIESKKTMDDNGNVSNEYSSTVKASIPGLGVVFKNENGQQNYSGVESELASVKIGFFIGIDASLTVNVATNNTYVNAPPSGNPIASDHTTVQIYVPDKLPVLRSPHFYGRRCKKYFTKTTRYKTHKEIEISGIH